MADKVRPRFKKGPPRHFVREWRDFRGMTQEKLAEAAGLTPGAISQLERGEVGYTQRSIEALADAMSCSPSDLTGRNPVSDDFEPIQLFAAIPKSNRPLAIRMLKSMADDSTGTK